MFEEILYRAETPFVFADMAQVKKNIANMQAMANRNGCQFRPHIKTHKSVEIARMQIAAGACGITCAKVSEAEVMADGGIDNIFIAYPLWGKGKLERAMRLNRRLGRLILGADSYECAAAISQTAVLFGGQAELRLEIETGARRTGIRPEGVAQIAGRIVKLPHIRLTGLYTFKGLNVNGTPTLDARAAAKEECEILGTARDRLAEAGITGSGHLELSGGSTPTAEACAETGLLDELRPGTYVFNDYMTFLSDACKYEDIAARICTTVVSAPAEGYAVLDGGSKVFSADITLERPPFYFTGYAHVPGKDDLLLDRLSEEHGMIRGKNGETGLKAGERLALTPAHICPAINMREYIYAYEGGSLRKLRVDARGMCE